MTYVCSLCTRVLQGNPSKHHLIPRHKNKKNKKNFTREEVHKQANVCHPCHDQIHTLFTEKEFEYEFNTVEKLKSDERIQKWINFIRNKPDGFKVPHRK